jgi:hypothetical protein
VVIRPGSKPGFIPALFPVVRRWTVLLAVPVFAACATGDLARMKTARGHFAKGEFERAENQIFSSEVLENKTSRLQHYLWLASLAAGQESYEKVLHYANRARDLAKDLRSDRGGFEWMGSDYKSNPIEFSLLHYFLVVANLRLADQGMSPAWSVPELKLKNGLVLAPAESRQARVYSPREIADFRIRARAELKAWDHFLVILKRTYPGQPFYQEDVLARILGSYVHGGAGSREERRTGELLGEEGGRIPDHPGVKELFSRMVERARDGNPGSFGRLVLIESGLMPELKTRKTVLGLSTLFRGVEDPGQRLELERLGLHALLEFAPEFGLVAVTGAIAGAATSDPDDSPGSLSGAADRSFGFEVSFPDVDPGSIPTETKLVLAGPGGKRTEHLLQPLEPLRGILSRELRERREKEWLAKSTKIGLQDLALLIPAVIAYRDAVKDGDVFRRLAILAGFFIGKKVIDRANAPDLRSWSLLPELISGDLVVIEPGNYSAEFVVLKDGKEKHFPLGEWKIGPEGPFLLHHRVLDPGDRDL